MKATTILSALVLFIILVGGKCTEKETTNGSQKSCKHTGVIKDLTGLDGCGLVIESEGKTFEPAVLPEGLTLNAGDSIAFSYRAFDGASICMVGELIEVTCLQVIKAAKPTCKPFEVIRLDSSLNFEMSPYTLNSHRVADNKLYLNITYSGCGNYNDQRLYLSKSEMKSLPPQRICVLSFKPQACEALITADLCFDVSGLKYETVLLLKTKDGIERITVSP